MHEMFEKLEPAKKERIINAAMAEFARKEYSDASTNAIVNAAQISKGILFRYFGSKKNLYLYLYRYAREVTDKEIYAPPEAGKGDLPSLLMQLGRRKLEVLKRYPGLTEFIAQAKGEKSPDVREELEKIGKERSFQLKENRLFNSPDMSPFKPEFRNEQTVKLIRWALEGCAAELQGIYTGQDIRDPASEKFIEEYEKYVSVIRQAFFINSEGGK